MSGASALPGRVTLLDSSYAEPQLLKPIREPTARQAEVVEALSRGLSYREIAEEIGVAVRTVRAHVQAVALLLPNPAGLPARSLVKLWASRSVRV